MEADAQSEASQQAPAKGRDLNSAIIACFSSDITVPPFEDRLLELTAALTNQRNVSIWTLDGPDARAQNIAQAGGTPLDGAIEDIVTQILEQAKERSGPFVVPAERYLAAIVALTNNRIGALVVELPASGAMARSLVYERLTLLANMSFAQFRNSDLVAQSEMIQTLTDIARGDHSRLQPLADALAQLIGADYAAASIYTQGTLGQIAISGQSGPAKRAQLPAQLRTTMNDIVAKKVSGLDRLFASPDGADGLVLVVEKPARNHGVLQLAGAVFCQAQQAKAASKWTAKRFVKLGAAALIAVGILLIPVPDGVELSARVEASNKRIITAPLSSVITEVLVRDRQQVVAGQTPLLQLDTNEIAIDLIGSQAERAKAVLERETARASRNAALLRNAELEVARLDARIDFLQFQRETSTLIAPITGIAILPELQQRVGSSVRQGEVLMEVADPDALRLSLAIVEQRISKVGNAAKGTFRPDYDPTLRLPATISKISPSVDNTQDVPVIQAQAEFDEAPQNLRPGLSGIFAIDQEYRPLGQVIYRTFRNWVLLRVWL